MQLPPEIWIIVFRWATYPPHGFPAPYYEPFCAASESFNEPLKTKRALVQVCRLWRDIATIFLYEDLRIGHDSALLRSVLADHHCTGNPIQGSSSLGRFVHRLELRYSQTVTDNDGDTRDVVGILASCTSLKTLVRPSAFAYSARYQFPAEIVSLSSLTRLEWCHVNDAALSGGINSLTDVLRNAPSLQLLVLGSEALWKPMQSSSHVRLPALTTLRLKRMNTMFAWQISRWELPSLVHVVVDFPADLDALGGLWHSFGSQLCTVEFGRHIGFHLSDQISEFLRWRVKAKVFNYFINFMAPPLQPSLVEQPFIQRVGIHAFPCGLLRDNWRHLKRHFDFLASPFLPALKHVVLYGDWEQIISDPRIPPALDHLTRNGRTVLLEDRLTSPCEHLR